MLEAKEIGRRLAKLRGDMSRGDVAKIVGVSVSAISMYENGTRIPRDSTKVKFSELYHMSVQEIFFKEKCHI